MNTKPTTQQEQSQLLAGAAFSDGARAGRMALPASLNPHHFGTELYKEWYRGWFQSVTERAA